MAAGAALAVLCAGAPGSWAAPPAPPQISEPPAEGALVNAADVHMEAYGYSDPDGNPHQCSEWQIVDALGGQVAWQTACLSGGATRTHVHFGDGFFTNAHAG